MGYFRRMLEIELPKRKKEAEREVYGCGYGGHAGGTRIKKRGSGRNGWSAVATPDRIMQKWRNIGNTLQETHNTR